MYGLWDDLLNKQLFGRESGESENHIIGSKTHTVLYHGHVMLKFTAKKMFDKTAMINNDNIIVQNYQMLHVSSLKTNMFLKLYDNLLSK